MSDKVKLPKEIGTYIEDLLINSTKEEFLAGILGNANTPKFKVIREYFKGDFDTLLQALVNDYEIETPEDKVREYYEALLSNDRHNSAHSVKHVLDVLNINIKGVNA